MERKEFGMKHTQGPYEDYRLWSEEPWKDRISRIDPVVQYIGEHTVLDQQHCKAVLPDEESVKHTYDGKTGAYLYPEFFSEWKAKGITVVVKQITEHWMAAMPCAAFPKSGPLRETLVVFLQGTYEDRFWPMHIAYAYDRYLEMAARENRIVIFVLSNGRADVERTYVNLLQEACCLFPCDTDKLYLDLSTVRGSGKKIRDLTDKPLAGRNGVLTGDTDSLVFELSGLSIPVLSLKGNWEYRGSLGRDLMMLDKYSMINFDRERTLRSETGRKLMEGIRLEYDYNTIDDPGLREHIRNMGLDLEVHYTKGERWLTLVPEKKNTEKLPVLCVLQEVYEGNEHLAVTALAYFYEALKIAARGDCMLLFFVLEDNDSNDLLCELIDECGIRYSADLTRVYVTGHSHDGRFTLEFSARNWRKVAAAATLGNSFCLEDARKLGAAGVTDERMEQLHTIELPLANYCGCCEHGGKLPLNVDARTLPVRPGQEFGRTITLEDRIRGWQRRLYAWNCRPVSAEEMLAVKDSPNPVERVFGVPVDRSEIVEMDGFKHYIGDFRDKNGRYLLRMTAHENMPHMPLPAMLELAWDFLSRFSRDPETGKITDSEEQEKNE